jgi:hypothetical protein
VKFKTTDIIARIDALLAERLADAEAAQLKANLVERDSASNWRNEHAEDFRYFAKDITYKLDKGLPITFDDVPEGIQNRYQALKFYSKPSGWAKDDALSGNLRKLRNALQASQEDTVSPTAIKQLGFQDVTFLFTAEASK